MPDADSKQGATSDGVEIVTVNTFPVKASSMRIVDEKCPGFSRGVANCQFDGKIFRATAHGRGLFRAQLLAQRAVIEALLIECPPEYEE